MRIVSIALFAVFLSVARAPGGFADEPRPSNTSRLKSSAVTTLDDGRHLFAAHRETGAVSVVDTAAGRVVNVKSVGRGLSAIAPLPDHRHLIALDEAGDRLILLRWDDPTLQVASTLAIASGPVDLVMSKDGKRGSAASKWSRRLTLFAVDVDASQAERALTGCGASATIRARERRT